MDHLFIGPSSFMSFPLKHSIKINLSLSMDHLVIGPSEILSKLILYLFIICQVKPNFKIPKLNGLSKLLHI